MVGLKEDATAIACVNVNFGLDGDNPEFPAAPVFATNTARLISSPELAAKAINSVLVYPPHAVSRTAGTVYDEPFTVTAVDTLAACS
jgi:hypothetical protein